MSRKEETKPEAQTGEGYRIAYDNLAIPEIHTGHAEAKPEEAPSQESVTYDTVAVPEIHIRKKPRP